MQVFVIINIVGIMINADVNVKNWLTKECVIKDLFVILVNVNVSVIKYVMLDSIKIMKIINAGKRLNCVQYRLYY